MTGPVFIIIDAYYIIETFLNRQRAVFFGVKMQDGRNTHKQNRDQKLNNELHQINKILTRKR